MSTRLIKMDEELKEKLLKILLELPTENAYIDYKEFPYFENKKADFIKDICGFLNSIDAYKKDKFIIFGVQNNPLKKVGLKKELMYDDASYQDLCDKIEPRPIVETGIISFENNDYGYIYIPKENNDRIYSIIDDYPKQEITRFEEKVGKISKVYASTAYIRRGSKNCILKEYDRRYIYENDKLEKNKKNNDILKYSFAEIENDDTKDILKICALFGSWSDSNDNDKRIISNIIGVDYNLWIKELRKLLDNKSEYIEFKNPIWKIKKRDELIGIYSQSYFDNEIEKFKDALIHILNEIDPKFDLESEKRIMANILDKKCNYSNIIKTNATESLAIIRSIKEDFINCEEEINKMLYGINKNIFENPNWKLIASLEREMPLLAEADPDSFLDGIDQMLTKNINGIQRLLIEKEEYVFTTKYTTGLYWALELLAWQPKYLNRVCMYLTKIAQYDKESINVMTRILLPWYPQTKADSNLRKVAIKTVLKENEDIGWKLLNNLMPNAITNSFPTYKPKWNNLIDEDIKVTNKDLYEQYKSYIKIAMEHVNGNVDRIKKMISILDDISKELFEEICEKVLIEQTEELSENDKFEVWNELENLINRHKKFSTTEWALPEEAIKILEDVSEKIKPSKDEILYKRIFNMGYWDLFSEKDDYDVQAKKLRESQKEAIRKIKIKGLEKVIEFSNNVKDPFVVGICLSEVGVTLEEEKIILKLLDKNKNEILFVKGYIRNKFYKVGYKWLESIGIDQMSKEAVSNFLTELPNNIQTWYIVSKILDKNEYEYWKKVDIRALEKEEEYDYAIEKLIEYNRPVQAIELISMAIHEKKNYKLELADKALNETLNFKEYIKSIDIYDIKNIIKDLQEKDYNEENLFKIEWSYLKLLDENEYKPLTIEKKIASSPQVFSQIINLVYKARSDSENKENSDSNLAMNAYDLLKKWTLIPGTNDNGSIEKDKLLNWLDETKKIAIKSDRLEVTLYTVGEVLFHAPKDKNGFWINEIVAEILDKEENEELRRGYSTEAFNSVGVVSLDKEGTVWKELEKKWDDLADQTELKGYIRFAGTLRKLSKQYQNQAKYERKHYDF